MPDQDRWPPDDLDDWPADAVDDLLADDPWLADDPDFAEDPKPAGREVLKAGFWDRSRGDGGGFAAGGVVDRVPPGPTLAGFAGDAWNDGLEQLSDDELIGVLRAARRLTSWATAMELAAVADLWRRRTVEEDAGDDGAARYAAEEIAAALTLAPARPEDAHTGDGTAGARGSRGSVNLTLPLVTWLGLAEVPGHAAGYGPLDATDSRALATALAARADNKWCLTLTDRDGRPVAHGCARPGRNEGRRRAPPRAKPPDKREAAQHPGTARAGPGGMKPAWTFTVTLLDTGPCDQARETLAYEPSPGLRHLVEARQFTCTFPGCRRPATQCDLDHTVPYHQGGRTCLCNLAPLCRRHHEVKQTAGWALEQASPGVMTWTTPAGRRYTVLGRPGLSPRGV